MIRPWRRHWIEERLGAWLKLGVVLSVLALAAYLGRRPSTRWVQLIILGTVGPLVFILLMRQPAWGVLALIPASLLVPLEIGTGTGTSLNATMLTLFSLLGLWALEGVLRRGGLRLFPSRTFMPALALAAVAVLAFINGNIPWLAFAQPASLMAQIGGLVVFVLSAGAFLLAARQIPDLRWLRRLTGSFLALGAVYIVGRLVPGPGWSLVGRFQNGSTGSLFWAWLVALAFSQAAFNRRLDRGWRLALGGLVLATFYVSLVQNRAWASGWVPSLVAVVVILWAGAPRLRLWIILAVAAVAALSLNELSGLIMADEEYSAMTRWEAWRILAEIVKVNPVLGLGPANYYHYTPLYPILGWAVQFNSHNQYVDLVAQTGLLGLVCFVWFAWEVGRLGWRLRSQVPDGFARAYVYGALGGLGGTLVAGMLGDWVLPFVYNIGLTGMRASALGWLFLGGVVVLEKLYAAGDHGRADSPDQE
jgi:O-antigen ligase